MAPGATSVKYNFLYFINTSILSETNKSFDRVSLCWKSKRNLDSVYKNLSCQYCSRTFRRRFGLRRHVKQLHGEDLSEEFAKVNSVRHRQYRRDVREYSSDEDAETDEDLNAFVSSQDLSGYRENPRKSSRSRRQRNSAKCGDKDVNDDDDDDDDVIYIEEVERSSPDSKITTFDRPTWKCLRKLPDFQPEVILRDCYDFQESVYELPKKFHPSEYPWLRKEYSRNVDEDETEAVFGEETDGVDEEEEDINNSSPEMEDTDLAVIALASDDPALEKESSEASELTEWAEKMLPLPPGMTPGEPESGSDPLAVLSGEDDPGQDILISESEKKENPKHCFKFKEEDPEEDNESLPPKLKNTARKSAPLKVGSKALTSLPARKRPLNSTAIKLNEQIKQEDLKLVKKEKLDAIQDSDGTEVVEILSSDEEEIENISAGRSITSQAGKPLGSAGSSNNVSEDSEYEPSRPATKKLKRESNQAGTGARHEEIIDLT